MQRVGKRSNNFSFNTIFTWAPADWHRNRLLVFHSFAQQVCLTPIRWHRHHTAQPRSTGEQDKGAQEPLLQWGREIRTSQLVISRCARGRERDEPTVGISQTPNTTRKEAVAEPAVNRGGKHVLESHSKWGVSQRVTDNGSILQTVVGGWLFQIIEEGLSE